MNLPDCLDRRSAGGYRFAGHDVAGFEADQLAWVRREAFGFVFQDYQWLPGCRSATCRHALPHASIRWWRWRGSSGAVLLATLCHLGSDSGPGKGRMSAG